MSRDDYVPRAQPVGDLQNFAVQPSVVADLFDLRHFQSQDANHTAWSFVRRRLHRLSASLNEAQAIFKTETTGKHQCRVLAQAQTGCGRAWSEKAGSSR